jgi:response regulator RpfG family c-di-GMP phosphodiesterase
LRVADVFERLISRRPYKEAMPHDGLVDHAQGARQLRSGILDVFLSNFQAFADMYRLGE